MPRITVDTFIAASPDRCFDLARSIELHAVSAASSGESIVSPAKSGLLELGDTVTFRGRHFGFMQTLTAQITAFDRPRHFRDSQVKGIFQMFDHDHYFEPVKNASTTGTLMRDVFEFRNPFGPLGRLADFIVAHHLESFLKTRNQIVKNVAEGDEFKKYLP